MASVRYLYIPDYAGSIAHTAQSLAMVRIMYADKAIPWYMVTKDFRKELKGAVVYKIIGDDKLIPVAAC